MPYLFFNSKQKQILPNMSMEQVAQTTHKALGKRGGFHHHFTQISRNGGNAEWCVIEVWQKPHPALEILFFTLLGQRKCGICMCCIFNLMFFLGGLLDTYRSTCWNPMFINSLDIVRNESTNGNDGNGMIQMTGAVSVCCQSTQASEDFLLCCWMNNRSQHRN